VWSRCGVGEIGGKFAKRLDFLHTGTGQGQRAGLESMGNTMACRNFAKEYKALRARMPGMGNRLGNRAGLLGR
jgi:hypothetical protein